MAGRLEPLASAAAMLAAVYRSVLPGALSLGLTTEERSERWFAQLARDAAEHGQHAALWPLMIGAWKRKLPYAASSTDLTSSGASGSGASSSSGTAASQKTAK